MNMPECAGRSVNISMYIYTFSGTFGIFRHNQAYSGTLTYSELCITLDVRTLEFSEPEVYSEPLYIQNPVKHLQWSVL